MCHSRLITDITESTLFRLEKFTWLEAKTDFNYVPGFFFFSPSSLSISHCVLPAWSLSQWGRTWLSSYLFTSDIFWLRMGCVENGLCYLVCSIVLVRRHHSGATHVVHLKGCLFCLLPITVVLCTKAVEMDSWCFVGGSLLNFEGYLVLELYAKNVY